MDHRDEALVRLGRLLRGRGYRFTTITPESHRRVNGRPGNEEAHSLRDVLGWSRPFASDVLPAAVFRLLEEADVLSAEGSLLRSRVRISSAGAQLYVHSAFPTVDADSVFFGPDTYRYLAYLARKALAARRVVDVGCGSGAGGIAIAGHCERVVLADINELALRYARVNAEINEVKNIEIVSSDVLRDIADPFDLVISNPPYLIDDQARLYRDGGGCFGEGLSVEIVRQSMNRLAGNGRVLLYTASAIVEGVDTFRTAVEPLLQSVPFTYEELDPDVFGEELDSEAYAGVDRIAVIGLEAGRPAACNEGGDGLRGTHTNPGVSD